MSQTLGILNETGYVKWAIGSVVYPQLPATYKPSIFFDPLVPIATTGPAVLGSLSPSLFTIIESDLSLPPPPR